ncbi:MAG: hypothetical protein ISS69_09185 [Phycisphaerae bacterium]|nr:hypothetical protein [Planctomycetota bacterium]MBL7220274.1 hypothetical protein [Phycisphaerae bacterium]
MTGFVQKNGIFVPAKKLDPVLVFIDETYLPGRTAIVQAAVAFTRQAYRDLIVPECGKLLKQLGPDAKEFKGSNLSKGNRAIYQQFLERVTGVVGAIAEKAPLRAVVSVDSVEPYSGDNFNFVDGGVRKALNAFGISNIPKCVAEFSRQMLWLRYHLPKIIPEGLANELTITFDNQHKYAKELRNPIATGLVDQPRSLRPLSDLLTPFANILLQGALEPSTGPVKVEKFDFLWSEESFGVQAADLLANLTYHGLRYEHGFQNKKTKLKRDILYDFIPEAITCAELQSGLSKVGDDLVCVNPQLLMTMQLNPGE